MRAKFVIVKVFDFFDFKMWKCVRQAYTRGSLDTKSNAWYCIFIEYNKAARELFPCKPPDPCYLLIECDSLRRFVIVAIPPVRMIRLTRKLSNSRLHRQRRDEITR